MLDSEKTFSYKLGLLNFHVSFEKINRITCFLAQFPPAPHPKKKGWFDYEHFDQGFGFIVAPNFPSDAGLQDGKASIH